MRSKYKLFNMLSIYTMGLSAVLPLMTSAIYAQQHKHVNPSTTLHASKTNNQILKANGGISPDDYTSMMMRYITDNSQTLDNIADNINKQKNIINFNQVTPGDAKIIVTEWQWFVIPDFMEHPKYNDKHSLSLSFTPKGLTTEYSFWKELPYAQNTQDLFKIEQENGENKGFLNETSVNRYDCNHFNEAHLYSYAPGKMVFSNYLNWTQHIPNDCFLAADGSISFDPSTFTKIYREDAYWTAVWTTRQTRTCKTGDRGEASAKDWTMRIELANTNNKVYDGSLYSPSNLLQLNKLGYDKTTSQFYSTYDFNKHLMKVALSVEFNQEMLDTTNNWRNKFLDIERSGKSYNSQTGEPNPNTVIPVQNSYYWGQLLGYDSGIQGGLDLWFPLNVDGKAGMNGYSGYDDPSYLQAVDELFDHLQHSSSVVNDGQHTPMLVTYDNYFKIRDWCHSFCIKHGYFPSWDETSKPDDETLYHALTENKNISNSDWVQWDGNYLDAGEGNNHIDVDPTNLDYLEKLAILLKREKFDVWNNYTSEQTGTITSNWDNPNEDKYLGQNVDYKIIPTLKKKYPNVTKSQDGWLATTNFRSYCQDGDTQVDEECKIQPNEEYVSDNQPYSLSNQNHIKTLQQKTSGKIHSQSVSFKHGSQDVTTDGVYIPTQCQFAEPITNKELLEKQNVQIRSYEDAPYFYLDGQDGRDKVVNPNYEGHEADHQKEPWNPDYQPYILRPASEVYSVASSRTNSDSVEAILKNIFYDYKNNCPATPIANANMYDEENFNYDVEENISNLKLETAIDDGQGAMEVYCMDYSDPNNPVRVQDCEVTYSGFQASITPAPIPGGIKPNTFWIVFGSVIGSLAIVVLAWYIIWNRKRGTNKIHPDVKKAKKLGEYDE